MQWEIVIGLETHAQLSTQSKIFSGAAIAYGAAPNTQACAVDLALPGVLPVFNRVAAEKAVKFGLAINARINRKSVFERKNYFYPDLPKGYQISQLELPIVAEGGTLRIQVAPATGSGQAYEKEVCITRAHLEEDAGKSIHGGFGEGGFGEAPFDGLSGDFTGIDLNRAGTPLLEIVTEPDMRSSAEAVAYAKTLHSLVRWIGICDGNMQEGSFRCDANVSVRPKGSDKLGTRCEIKNLNSFKFMEKAIDFEVQRQIDVLESGGRIIQETRLYDPDRDETRSMRSKEEANDYRYFPDPDLLPLVVDEDFIEAARQTLPELPQAKRERFMRDYTLPAYDAEVLTSSREMANFYEAAVIQLPTQPKLVANWIIGEISSLLSRDKLEIESVPISAAWLAGLLTRVSDGTISAKSAKEILDSAWGRNQILSLLNEALSEIDTEIEAKGLKQVSDSGAIEKIVDEVLSANPQMVAEFQSGKEKAFNALIGQTMKASKGKANPAQVNEILKKKLAG
jgi:aspartyl-tRNA(Asn)/glutamyl-tRNA(Gln) amidotransferase subunit B